MAKDGKQKKHADAPAEQPGVPAAGPPERLTAPSRPVPAPTTDDHGRGVTDTVVAVAGDAARVVQRVLPARTPAYLGGAALLVLGVVDLPAAAGGALVYEALRRWRPAE
ncbi:hypothetical protein GCM10023200_10750 [Actinomycetospora chlora]|uniref:Uncharacterized protein n=1 Tax=Actinomycetospora chlora TaxID=663608 RepID=A0ABP9AGQ1_9PSEU